MLGKNRLGNFFTPKTFWLYVLVFVVSTALFGYLQFDPTFADPDSFYHAKMALMLRDRGAITEFPWLSATTLRYSYIDHHFLYHLLLIPFVSFFPPLVGLKVATVLFASAAIVAAFWLLRQFNVRGAHWYAFFLLTVEPFIFRLSLAKAQALVLILLFISLYCLFKRYYLAFLVSVFFYVWLYAGWPLVAVFTLLYLCISWPQFKRSNDWLILQRVGNRLRQHNLQVLVALIVGLGSGLLLSPYFAKNLYFYWQQSFKIAVINYQNLIGVGNEWYPFSFYDLVASATPLFFLFFVATALFIFTYRKQSLGAKFFLAFTFLFFVLTLKSRRNVEYFVPLATLFSAFAISGSFETVTGWLKKNKLQSVALVGLVTLCLALTPVFYRDVQVAKNSLKSGIGFNQFAAASSWLREQTSRGSIVFHSDWDEFPLLFYHNDWNYYIVGLDPTFMYEHDKDLHRRWVDITVGRESENLSTAMAQLFDASYVFINIRDNEDFDRNVAASPGFVKVYEDSEARIYRVAR